MISSGRGIYIGFGTNGTDFCVSKANVGFRGGAVVSVSEGWILSARRGGISASLKLLSDSVRERWPVSQRGVYDFVREMYYIRLCTKGTDFCVSNAGWDSVRERGPVSHRGVDDFVRERYLYRIRHEGTGFLRL